MVGSDQLVHKLVSGGFDSVVKVWEFVNGGWKLESALVSDMHTECVRDVAWAPVLGLAKSTIASASQDGKVVIWTKGNSGAHGNSGIVRAQFRSNLLASSMVRLSPSRRRRIMVCLLMVIIFCS